MGGILPGLSSISGITSGISGILNSGANQTAADSKVVSAQQPGLIAVEQNGIFGAANSQAVALSTQAAFQNQSPAALAALQSNPANVIGAATGNTSASTLSWYGVPWYGWLGAVAAIVFLLEKK